MKSNFCTMPFNSLEISPDGTCQVCCKIQQPSGESRWVLKDDGDSYNVLTDKIEEVWNSIDLKLLRQKFLRNERPEECRLCWTEEASGVKSLRQQTINNPVHQIEPVISYLSLKLSNKCNLACRICSPHLSSLWQSQFNKLNIPLTPAKMFQTIDLEKFDGERLDSLHKLSVNLRHLLIYGGEPLVNDEVIRYLKFLVDSKLSKNIQLTLNTNGTIYDLSLIKLFDEFKHVDIFLSIDDVEQRFEYQRWPAKWTKIHENILKYSTHKNLNLEFYPTVSVLNVLSVGKFLEKLSSYNIPITFNNFIHQPNILSIKNLPTEIKKQVVQVLTNIDFSKFNFNTGYSNPKESLINFINLDNDPDYDLTPDEYAVRLTASMKIFDDQRKTEMKDYLPEFYRMIYEH